MIAINNVRRFAHPLLIIIFVLISQTILTVGLPIPRQEHASGSDLIAGEAFLSILMGGSTQNRNNEEYNDEPALDTNQFGLRTSRSRLLTNQDSIKFNQQIDEGTDKIKSSDNYNVDTISEDVTESKDSTDNSDLMQNIQIKNEIEQNTDDFVKNLKDEPEEGTIIAVRVSSSVGHSMINKHVYTNEENKKKETTEKPSTVVYKNIEDELVHQESENNETEFVSGNDGKLSGDQEAVASEDSPSLIAEANKSEFHVDEMEPISRDYDSNPHTNPHNNFDGKAFPGTVIYHNEGSNNRARSVSYSTVIQALPSVGKTWSPTLDNSQNHHNHQNQNLQAVPESGNQNHTSNQMEQSQSIAIPVPVSYHSSTANENHHQASLPSSASETKDYYVTSKYEDPSRYYSPEPTERNWGIPEQNYHEPSKPYTPIVYGQPEQNYEVDEAVSVETNGRAHGIQPVQAMQAVVQGQSNLNSNLPNNPNLNLNPNPNPNNGKILPGNPNKKDDNQKVGYVVEGRNYRKYRVEERTSDGFIVGEYGVVRHDDGSLRGVRYTADGTISPRLIYDALMKFLSL